MQVLMCMAQLGRLPLPLTAPAAFQLQVQASVPLLHGPTSNNIIYILRAVSRNWRPVSEMQMEALRRRRRRAVEVGGGGVQRPGRVRI